MMRTPRLAVLLFVSLAAMGAGDVQQTEDRMAFQLTSPAFLAGQSIPARYTCEGEDISPPLAWADPPLGTQRLALITDDPDAPMGRWVHWVVYNILPSVRDFPEAMPSDAELPNGVQQGRTDFGRTGYGGPCPPSGTHRYVFTLYALDAPLTIEAGASARQLEQALGGHILAKAQLMGTYRRRRFDSASGRVHNQ